MTGTLLTGRSIRSSWMPSTSGRPRSSTRRSGGSSSTRCRPRMPAGSEDTAWPRSVSALVSAVRIRGSSSIRSSTATPPTVVPAGCAVRQASQRCRGVRHGLTRGPPDWPTWTAASPSSPRGPSSPSPRWASASEPPVWSATRSPTAGSPPPPPADPARALVRRRPGRRRRPPPSASPTSTTSTVADVQRSVTTRGGFVSGTCRSGLVRLSASPAARLGDRRPGRRAGERGAGPLRAGRRR